jgi:rare lipoprotein A
MRVTARAGCCASAVLLSSLLSACASNTPSRPPQRAGDSAVSPSLPGEEPRSARGNPPFYDVLGKRYHVLQTSSGYHQRGVASWYGRDFHGLSTSSGEPYDMFAMTAAHTTLPIPTWVEVTNLTNGKRVVVRVNDRGPFVANRLIDLSYAAATALDMVREGTTRVEVRAISSPRAAPAVTTAAVAPAPAPVPAPTPAIPPTMGALPAPSALPLPPSAAEVAPAQSMFVQVGAFSDRANAARLVERLRADGFGNPVVVTDASGRRMLHRVRLGPIRDSLEFDQLSARLRNAGVGDARLVTGP